MWNLSKLPSKDSYNFLELNVTIMCPELPSLVPNMFNLATLLLFNLDSPILFISAFLLTFSFSKQIYRP